MKHQPSEPLQPRLLDTKQAAAYCSCSYWTLRSMLQQGHIPVVKFPSTKYQSRPSRRVLIDKADLDAWLLTLKRNGVGL